MADDETTNTEEQTGESEFSPAVTVVSAEQLQQMITAITQAISSSPSSSGGSTTNSTVTFSTTQFNSFISTIGNIKTVIEAQTTELKERLTSLETKLDTDLKDDTKRVEAVIKKQIDAVEAQTTELGKSLETIDGRLHINIDRGNLHVKYKDNNRGDRGLAFIEASRLEASLIGGNSEDEDGGGSGDDEGGSDEQTREESAEVSEAIKAAQEETLKDFATYNFNVTTGERLTFKSKEDFDSSKTGLSFDFTRSYIEKIKDQQDTTSNEYALLVFESNMKTSEMEGETSIERMKTWNDLKEIQTVVITENTKSNTAFVYMPTDSNYKEPNTEEFKSVKEAMDWVVKEYQNAIGEQHMGISFMPVSSIERGCLLEDYRTKAKTQTAACEYT